MINQPTQAQRLTYLVRLTARHDDDQARLDEQATQITMLRRALLIMVERHGTAALDADTRGVVEDALAWTEAA